MAILQSPTTIDGSKVITEAVLAPGTHRGQVPIWNDTLHQWRPGAQTGASAAHQTASVPAGTYLSMGGGTLTGPLKVPSLTVAGVRVTANPPWSSIGGKPHTFPPSTHTHPYISKAQGDSYYAAKRHTHPTHAHPYLKLTGGVINGALSFANIASLDQKVGHHYTSGNGQRAPWIVVSGRAPAARETNQGPGCLWIQV